MPNGKRIGKMGDFVRILFLCTGNSCRSQMAEGLCRHFRKNGIKSFSAGIATDGLNPLAVKAMKEIGIDISSHQSKTIADLGDQQFEYVITVCSHAYETCPFFPALIKVIHREFDDPPKLAASATTEAEAMIHYRRVRDEIRDYVLSLPESLYDGSSNQKTESDKG